jgi:hypothetical protein
MGFSPPSTGPAFSRQVRVRLLAPPLYCIVITVYIARTHPISKTFVKLFLHYALQ